MKIAAITALVDNSQAFQDHGHRSVNGFLKWGRVHLIRPDGTVIKPLGTRDPEWVDTDEDHGWIITDVDLRAA